MKVTTFADNLRDDIRGLCLDRQGNLLVAEQNRHCIRRIDATSGIVTTVAGCGEKGFVDGNALTEAKLRYPYHFITHEDTIYVCDTFVGTIRKVRDGIVSTPITGLVTAQRITVDGGGCIVVVDYGIQIKVVDPNSGTIRALTQCPSFAVGMAVSYSGIYVCTEGRLISCWRDGQWKTVNRTSGIIGGFKMSSSDSLLFAESHCIRN